MAQLVFLYFAAPKVTSARFTSSATQVCVATPKPEWRNPTPETRNPEPDTRNPDPGARNPKCETPLQVRIGFDQDTDAVAAPASSCAALVQGAGLGASPTCVWQGASPKP